MNLNPTTLTLIGCASAAVLGLSAQLLEKAVIGAPGGNLYGFGSGRLAYLIVPGYFCLLGLILSRVVLLLDSPGGALGIALLFGLIVSAGYLQSALAMLAGSKNLDKVEFKSDVFQICANLIIFPLIGFLLWKLKTASTTIA